MPGSHVGYTSLHWLHQSDITAGRRSCIQQNRQLAFPEPILGEADEIFQGHNPCLTVVDARSFTILQLSPQTRRDATTWGVTFLDLQDQGIRFQDLACDFAAAFDIRLSEKQGELIPAVTCQQVRAPQPLLQPGRDLL